MFNPFYCTTIGIRADGWCGDQVTGSNEYNEVDSGLMEMGIPCVESLSDEWVHAWRLGSVSHGSVESTVVQGIRACGWQWLSRIEAVMIKLWEPSLDTRRLKITFTWGEGYHMGKTHTWRRDCWNTNMRWNPTSNENGKVEHYISENKTHKLEL